MSAAAQSASSKLAGVLELELSTMLPRGSRAALVNYPNHSNVGDSALYAGTTRLLRRMGVHITYRCDFRTYSAASLASQIANRTNVILINGGGNLGDQYPQQEIRERVLADFPDTATIQLPQSIWFEDPKRLTAFASLAGRHRDFTLLVRDRASYELALEKFDVAVRLAPDLAFGLGPLPPPVHPSDDIVWLRRSDRESAGTARPASIDSQVAADWLHAQPWSMGRSGRALLAANRWLSDRIAKHPWLSGPLAATFDQLARHRLDYGCQFLARGRVIVTDRLHGVILATLMGIPVVAVDTRNGKISSFIDTWLSDPGTVHLAPDHPSGLSTARLIVATLA